VQKNSQPRSFVIVHGGWGGGFTFAAVAKQLRSRGHHVYTPALTGLGPRSHLLREDIGLDVHIEDVINEIRWEALDDVVLVGHSYAGVVITGVADRIPERLSALVYLDAFLPEDGRALIDIAVIPEIIELLHAARDRGDPALPFPAEFAAALGISAADVWKLTPHPLRTFFEPLRLTGRHKTVPRKVFVLAEQWPDHQQTFQRLKNDPSWVTVSVPTGHMIQTEIPERCATLLEETTS
jgi:pimeloyl-ACP methyl ester carboxylesterase